MSVDPEKLAELTALYEELNLPELFPDPEQAAREELESGESQLATYSFLKWLTDAMEQLDDPSWIRLRAQNKEKDKLIGPVLQRLLDLGADPKDLNLLVREKQFEICDHVCYMLDQIALEGEVPIQDFGLYHVGGGDSPTTDRPIARLDALHELIGQWDTEHGPLGLRRYERMDD